MIEDHDLERRRLAYRQAGYAVACYAQGNRIPDLALGRPAAPAVPADNDLPRRWPVALGSGTRHRTELDILARWTGLVAEARACLGDREPPGGWGEARAPMATLGRRVTRGLDENDAYLEWLRRRAVGLIDLPDIWAAVEAVAESLLANQSLGSRQATDLVSGALRARRRRSGLSAFFRPPD